MSLSITPTEGETEAPCLRPAVHWAGLVGLLLGETVLLGVVFRAGTLVGDAAWWAGFVDQIKLFSWVGTSAITGLLIFGAAQLRQPRVGMVECLRRPRVSWPLLLLHFVGFVGFAQVTGVITSQGLQHTPQASALFVIWFGAGLFTLLSWAAATVPGVGLGVVFASAVAGVVAWLAGGGTLLLWPWLKSGTFATVRVLLSPWFSEIVMRPEAEVIGTPGFQVQVGSGCSGAEGVGLMWVCLGLFLWCYRQDLRWPRALLLLPLGTALAWLANGLRIATLIAVGTCVSPEIGMGGFHSQAGWLTFNGIALGLMAVARRSRFLSRQEEAAGPEENPAAAYLGPLLALVAMTMITTALAEGLDVLYPLRVIVVAAVLVYFRQAYRVVTPGSFQGDKWPDSAGKPASQIAQRAHITPRSPAESPPAYRGLGWGWSWHAAGLGVAAFVLWMALEFVRGSPPDAGLRTGLASLPAGWAVAWICFRVVGSVVTVPLAEELGFRGYVLRRLAGADFRSVTPAQISWVALVVSSALFGLLHGRWLAGLVAGLLYGLALCRRGRVADAALAHAVTNGLIAAYVLATGTWSLWA